MAVTRAQFEAQIERIRKRWGEKYWSHHMRDVAFSHFGSLSEARFSAVVDHFIDQDGPVQPLIPDLRRRIALMNEPEPPLETAPKVPAARATLPVAASGHEVEGLLQVRNSQQPGSKSGDASRQENITRSVFPILAEQDKLRASGKSQSEIDRFLDEQFGLGPPACTRCKDDGVFLARYRDPAKSNYTSEFLCTCEAAAGVKRRGALPPVWDYRHERFYEPEA